MTEENLKDLKNMAQKIRCHIIRMTTLAGSGHPGGSLSAVEILTYLYFKEMKINPSQPKWEERDRFVLSKGHAAPVLYAALAEKGFFPTEDLGTLRKIDSYLQGHPDMRKVPGVEMSTGSLGTGFSTAVGMAMAGRLDKKDNYVFALLGDGETQEGQIWEAAMAGAHYKLNNLIAFIDYNGLQIDGDIANVMSPEPLVDKWRAFGWNVIEIDGHNFEAIEKAVAFAKENKEQPSMIIAKTIKGKGVSFMENEAGWHGKCPSPEEMETALCELEY